MQFKLTIVPLMKIKNSGYIINVSSRSVETPRGFLGGYSATKAALLAFNKQINVTADEEKIKGHRKLLCDVMRAIGFTSYQYEWWHFDIGDVFWSKKTNCPEVFGPLFGDEEFPKDL